MPNVEPPPSSDKAKKLATIALFMVAHRDLCTQHLWEVLDEAFPGLSFHDFCLASILANETTPERALYLNDLACGR